MKGVELYAQVRFAVQIEGVSRREAARRFGIDPRTVAKMLAFSVPPGYRRSRPPARQPDRTGLQSPARSQYRGVPRPDCRAAGLKSMLEAVLPLTSATF